MALPAPVALSIFSSYFALIIALFWLIIGSLPKCIPQNVSRTRVYMFIELTLASFAHTWYYMFAFMKRSFIDYELSAAADRTLPILIRVTNWLSNTALFEQAWAAVCRTPANWWWSEQLCLFTVGAWTVMLYTHGRSHRIKHVWAYMLLGQVVAISVASNLFYLALLLHPAPRPAAKAAPLPWTVHLPVLLSLWTVSRVPASLAHAPPFFLENLLTMHALLFLPFLPNRTLHRLLPPAPASYLALQPRTLYIAIHLTSLALRARTVLALAATLPPPRTLAGATGALWAALHAHPAQASIGWDVVWTTLSFVAWSARAPRAQGVFIPFAAGTAVASVGVVAPAVLALYA